MHDKVTRRQVGKALQAFAIGFVLGFSHTARSGLRDNLSFGYDSKVYSGVFRSSGEISDSYGTIAKIWKRKQRIVQSGGYTAFLEVFAQADGSTLVVAEYHSPEIGFEIVRDIGCRCLKTAAVRRESLRVYAERGARSDRIGAARETVCHDHRIFLEAG
jgi:hypothetical protein